MSADSSNKGDSLRIITQEELEKHDEDNEESQWIMIDGLVYDITEYKFEHPGGEDIMLEQAGADATESFENAGHSKDARRRMKDFVIGKVEGYKRPEGAGDSSRQGVHGDEDGGSGILGTLKYALVPLAIFGVAYLTQQYLRAQTQ